MSENLMIIQSIKNNMTHTSDIPDTVRILKTKLPSIFENKCFNDRKHSFLKEAASTETGHLFEHILLEHLKLMALSLNIYTDFNGVTEWNWDKDEFGVFKISITCPCQMHDVIENCLEKSIALMEEILDSKRRVIIPA